MCDTALPNRNVIITFGKEVFEMTLFDYIIRGTRPKTDGAVAKIIFGTGVGMALGLVAGLLLAPRSGSDTRQLVAENAKATAKILQNTLHETSEKRPSANDAIAKGS